jgi:hypothetical protein
MRLASFEEIGARLGVSEDTVQRDWKRAILKMGWDGIPLGVMRQTVEIVTAAAEPAPVIGCGSVECRRDWIELYGDYFSL